MNETDPIWQSIRSEIEDIVAREPMLASYLYETVLNHARLEDALSFHLAVKLDSPTIHALSIREVILDAFSSDPQIGIAVRADLQAVRERDPACRGYAVPLLYFKGFQAIQSYRVAHWLWGQGRQALALYFQSRVAEVFSVDIHPAARMGQGLLMDHATAVVIGETSVVGDNVSILHEVTLGGTGKESGDRHPKVGSGVLIGAGAKILGNVRIGEGAKIAAGSVVLRDVPPHCTVAGVPACIVGRPAVKEPAREMDHQLPLPGEGRNEPA